MDDPTAVSEPTPAEAWPEQTKQIEEIRVLSEEILLNTDQAIRVQALDISAKSFPIPENLNLPEKQTQVIIERAEIFEEYIKNGVIHDA